MTKQTIANRVRGMYLDEEMNITDVIYSSAEHKINSCSYFAEFIYGNDGKLSLINIKEGDDKLKFQILAYDIEKTKVDLLKKEIKEDLLKKINTRMKTLFLYNLFIEKCKL